MPATIAPPSTSDTVVLTAELVKQLEVRAAIAGVTSGAVITPPVGMTASAAVRKFKLNRPGGLGVQLMSPGLAAWLLHERKEQADAAAAQALWFKPFLPKTRYTLDVVAGPFNLLENDINRPVDVGSLPVGSSTSIQTIMDEQDAIGVYTALKKYLADENALTSLERVQFTTSQYATFTDQMSNVVKQLAGGANIAPIRYYTSNFDTQTFLDPANNTDWATALDAYTTAHFGLANVVSLFDPLADIRVPSNAPNGRGALVIGQQTAAQAWQAFSQATSSAFDTLIADLGQGQLASNQKPLVVPDTEISFFMDNRQVIAILLESPEPFPWQRIWNSFAFSSGLSILGILWKSDGTRGLIIPTEARGNYSLSVTFQGNIGAEAPCITLAGQSVTETVKLGTFSMGPRHIPRR